MGSATFFDAFNALSIAFVLPVLVPLWHITAPQIGLMIAASYVGQLLGALAFSWAAERYGRIPCAAAATAIFAMMSLACAGAWNFDVLLACRFIQGIGVGGEMPVAAVYISELSKARGRGRFFLLYEMIFPIGLMVTGQVARAAGAGVRMEDDVPDRRPSRTADRRAAAAAAGISALADRQGPPRRGRGSGHASWRPRPARRERWCRPSRRRAALPQPAPVAPSAPRQLERVAVAHLPRPHTDCLGAVGQCVPDCQQPQQLDADALHHGLPSWRSPKRCARPR